MYKIEKIVIINLKDRIFSRIDKYTIAVIFF